MILMDRFIPREKLSKRARKALDAKKRGTWAFSPVTKRVESKKRYNRKKLPSAGYDDYGRGECFFVLCGGDMRCYVK